MDLRKLKGELIKNKEIELELERDLAFQVGRQLERARIKTQMTQQMLAEKIGTHQSSIARAESGMGLPSLSFLKKIADALGAYLTPPRFVFATETQSKILEMRLEQDQYGTFIPMDKKLSSQSSSEVKTIKQEVN